MNTTSPTVRSGDGWKALAGIGARAEESSGGLAVVASIVVSFMLMMTYAIERFVPSLAAEIPGDPSDAYRYHLYAVPLSRWPLDEILTHRVPGISKAGYVQFLAFVYHISDADPLAGCVGNWLLWLGAGVLLARSFGSRALFVLWMLIPEAVDWTGTTNKEPLCTFLIALCMWLALGAEKSNAVTFLLRSMAVAAIAAVGATVRTSVGVLGLVPLLVVFERRFRPNRTSLAAIALLLVTLVVYASGDTFGVDFSAETAGLRYDGRNGYSNTSVLLRFKSDNPRIDLFMIPVRALAHIISPLNASPSADVALLAMWLSALVYVVLGIAIILHLRERRAEKEPLETRHLAAAWAAVMTLFFLGATGIIHERYRSGLLPGYLPLGVECLRRERQQHGVGRAATWVLGSYSLAFAAYMAIKFAL